MKLCSPEGLALAKKTLDAVARPPSLDGLRIGFLDNTKAPVDKIMAHLEIRLRERLPGMQAFHVSKTSMGIPAAAQAMESLRQNTDVVINALGD